MAHKKGQGSVKNGRRQRQQTAGCEEIRQRNGCSWQHHCAPARDEVFAGKNVGLAVIILFSALIDGSVRSIVGGRRVNVDSLAASSS